MVDPARYLLAEWDDEPVGGAGSYAFELTLPGGVQVDAAAISDVGCGPDPPAARDPHRADARASCVALADEGTPVAVLHASEGGIYRRFGYGPCTRWRQLRVDARRVRFRDDCPDPGGSLHLLQRDEAHDTCAAGARPRASACDRRAVPPGVVVAGGARRRRRLPGRDRRPPGHGAPRRRPAGPTATRSTRWTRTGAAGRRTTSLSVWELVGVTTDVEVALWRALVEHDLVATVTGPIAVDHPLFDVVVDGRQVGSGLGAGPALGPSARCVRRCSPRVATVRPATWCWPSRTRSCPRSAARSS